MNKDKLLENINLLGVPLMEAPEMVDANETIAELIRSGEIRYWEIFPVLLANSANKGLFEYWKAEKPLKNKERQVFHELVLLSLVLYRALDLVFPWAEPLFWSKAGFGKEEFDRWLDRFVKRETFVIGGKEMSPERLAKIFRDYAHGEEENFKGLMSKKEDLGLEYALSQVFAPKQRELFWKKVGGERLTKSEREYYSRTVRKKVKALANELLHQLAKSI
ncbi:MAG: hypothetical protein NT056_07765 [Proteobacteria bacterium]|nr:hypothetical protein [Pseudomonadota bacterium]